MRILLRFFGVLVMLVTLVTIHVGVASFLSFPWNSINTILLVLVVFLMRQETGMVVWISCAAHFFLELYAITPFGVLLFSGTFAMLLVYWLYTYFFTNRSLAAYLALAAFALVFYRAGYGILLLLTAPASLPWQEFFSRSVTELFLSVIVGGLIYGVLAFLAPQNDRSQYRIFTYE